MIFEPHSLKQQQAIFSDRKVTLALTGIQFGKTTLGSIWMKRHMFENMDPTCNFIITAPNYKIMQQSTLPAFLKNMEGEGDYHKGDALFRLHGGGTCYFRTSTEADSVVGITNVMAIWGDEAGKYSLYFWENMQARSSFRDCPIMLTTTPYTSNWIFKELVRPTKEGKRDDVLLIQASSNENPYFPKEEFERRRKTMDPRRFAALYLGVFEKMHGLVYNCFDESVHVIKPMELPSGTQYFAGVDWGYTDPFVLNVRAVTPTGHHFLVSEYYKTGMTINDMVIVAKQKFSAYGIKVFYAGPDQPGYIEEFSRNGMTCVGAVNDIRKGVDLHYDLIKTNRYYIFDTCKHAIDEYSTYHYPEPDELRPDQDSKEQNPVGQDDHAMDAERYCSISIARTFKKLAPVLPQETPKQMSTEKRIAMLKKGSNRHKGSETW
jgi:PBSX family phage terminase large subunit